MLVADWTYERELNALGFAGTVIFMDELEAGEADEELLGQIRKQAMDMDPLYGIFTSGSTRGAQGVVVSHRSVIDFIDCFTSLFDITEQDVIGNQAPFDFDVSVKDIYSGLKTGACVELIPKQFFLSQKAVGLSVREAGDHSGMGSFRTVYSDYLKRALRTRCLSRSDG